MAVASQDTSSVSDEGGMPNKRKKKQVQPDARFARPDCLFFGIGAQKSGTTWLHYYLANHPEVHVPKQYKELDYWSSFDRDQLAATTRTRERLRPKSDMRFLAGAVKKPRSVKELKTRIHVLGFYRKWGKCLASASPSHSHYADVLFHGAKGEACLGEIAPSYALLEREIFADMASLSNNARFVFLLRDPAARVWSGCRHELRTRFGAEGATTAAVQYRVQLALANSEDLALKRTRYDQTISALESVVSQDRIIYFFYETLFQQSEIDRFCDFLGITRRRADLERPVNVKVDAAGEIPPEVARKAREALAPTYDFCRAKFGTLPPEWQDKTVVGDA